MSSIWKTIRGYIWWTHDRGSLHYDVMVTLILAFIFVTPRFVNFKDKPVERTPHQTGVVVYPDGQLLVYQIDKSAVSGTATQESLLSAVEPYAGEVSIERYEPVKDARGQVTAYKVWVSR